MDDDRSATNTGGAAAPRARRHGVHYAFVILALTFLALLASAGLRAAPGVLLLPLQLGFGWDRTTVAAGAGIGILANGLVGPFAGAAMRRYGIRTVLLAGLALMAAATGASLWMTEPWHYILSWGMLSGIGSGAVAGVLAAAVVNRWFARRQGLMMGLLSASTATGSLIFLPVMASLAQAGDWRPVVRLVALAMTVLLPLVWLLMRERPEDVGTTRHGADSPEAAPIAPPRGAGALGELRLGAGDPLFRLLFTGFFVCGFTTNGLVGTHLIAFCGDRGLPAVQAAGWLALMGACDIVGATASGWLSDRYDPRRLLVAYFALRGASLLILPVVPLQGIGFAAFSIVFGLNWIATVPPTLRLVNARFGQHRAPILYGWIFLGHQAGAAAAAIAAGAVREIAGDYAPAFVISGGMALVVALAFAAASRTRRQSVMEAI